MDNFIYHNPTTIIFGKGEIARLKNQISKKQRILIVYGGGSIFKNGVMTQVKDALSEHNYLEFAGVEANPEYDTLMKAVNVVQNEKIDFILAVGGGSVLDGVKFIALCGANPQLENPWKDILINKPKGHALTSAIPIGSVITLPATGSEMNANFVVSQRKKQLKQANANPNVYPQFSIIDPETTYSLPQKQITNGLIDTFAHVTEQYIALNSNATLQDLYSASILRVIIDNGYQVLKDPNNYKVRADIFWASTLALNGLLSTGRDTSKTDWSTHEIGHELTALYNIDHGQSLAPILLANWKVTKDIKKEQLLHMAKHLYNIDENLTHEEQINLTIEKTTQFFSDIGINTKLSQYEHIPPNCNEKVIENLKNLNKPILGGLKLNLETASKIISTAY